MIQLESLILSVEIIRLVTQLVFEGFVSLFEALTDLAGGAVINRR